MRGNLTERFWAKVDRSGGPDACWPWTGALHRHDRPGYGRVNGGDGTSRYAHRLSWELHFGPIPEGLQVLHYCDNPPCVNPAHLWLGTNQDNRTDSAHKGRTARGERSPNAKLTEDDVRAIRALGGTMSMARIAAQFGVTYLPVNFIIHRKTWKHVE
jgi:hypothetical protein